MTKIRVWETQYCLPFFELLGGVRMPRAGDGGLSLDNAAGVFSVLCVATSACSKQESYFHVSRLQFSLVEISRKLGLVTLLIVSRSTDNSKNLQEYN